MRIAINASILGEQPTGTNVYTRQILPRMLESEAMRKHDVVVFTPQPLQLPAGVEQRLLPSQLGRSTRHGSNAIRRFFWNQLHFQQIARSFDIVYCPTYNTNLFAKNQIITIHDLLALRYPAQHPFQHYFQRLALPLLMSNAARVIAVSQATALDIQHFFPGLSPHKLRVIPNGYDPLMYQPVHHAADSEVLLRYGLDRYVLAIGATFPHKNLELLANAMGLLEPRMQSHHLTKDSRPLVLAIAGASSAYLRDLRSLCNSLGFAERIRFLGYVPDADLPALYRHARVFAYPSRFEGFGLPILEAMACGCPVVCSSTSSLPEVAGDAAVLCTPDDTEDWAESLYQLQAEGVCRTEYIRKGLAHCQAFSWENTAQGISRVLQELTE